MSLGLLLDTHIWLWSLLEPQRLGSRTLKALRNPDAELWLSPISVWELTVLVGKGRLRLNMPVRDWLTAALENVPLREAPLTHEVILETIDIHLSHRDPADYFLVATARVFDLSLVTADRRLISAKACQILRN